MINTDYDLELDRVVSEIKNRGAKKVLIQLGEGFKPRAIEIQQHIYKALNKDEKTVQVFFWLNSCYGKCDIPEMLNSKDNDIDLLMQFGH